MAEPMIQEKPQLTLEQKKEKESRTIFVTFLPPATNEETLKTLFQSYGEIVEIKVMLDRITNACKGFAFVEYANPESVHAAIAQMNGFDYAGKKLLVKQATHKSTQDDRKPNVYIAGLPSNYDEAALTELFSPYGTVIKSQILLDLNTHTSRNCGFVHFENPEQCEKAINALNGTTLPNAQKPLQVRFAQSQKDKDQNPVRQALNLAAHLQMSGGMYDQNTLNQAAVALSQAMGNRNYGQRAYTQRQPENSIFVYNIPLISGEEYLRALFQQYGAVLNVRVIYKPDGISKGFGFVNMANPNEAATAVSSLNGVATHEGKVLQVSFHSGSKKQW
eukprot:GCRY01000942.1.p1 GENE.GCRY01000942.1~~GCRY01000942.1.p1  ORF type:complete len:370 (+),score=52.51 GCRY01000942.1:113-1111(+)